MLTMILRRIFLGLATISIVSLIIFAGVEILPGDACTQYLEQDQADVELLEKCRDDLNLNRPAHERYTEWALGALTGDLGMSVNGEAKISDLVGARFANSCFSLSLPCLSACRWPCYLV